MPKTEDFMVSNSDWSAKAALTLTSQTEKEYFTFREAKVGHYGNMDGTKTAGLLFPICSRQNTRREIRLPILPRGEPFSGCGTSSWDGCHCWDMAS